MISENKSENDQNVFQMFMRIFRYIHSIPEIFRYFCLFQLDTPDLILNLVKLHVLLSIISKSVNKDDIQRIDKEVEK